VRHESLPLDALLARERYGVAGGDARRVVRTAVARRVLCWRERTLDLLVQEGLAVALEAERGHAAEPDLLPMPLGHQALSGVERCVQRRAELAVLARRSDGVGSAEQLHGQSLGEAPLLLLVEGRPLAGRLLGD